MKTAKIVKHLVAEGFRYSLVTEKGNEIAERYATSLNLRRHQPVKDELAAIATEQGYELVAN